MNHQSDNVATAIELAITNRIREEDREDAFLDVSRPDDGSYWSDEEYEEEDFNYRYARWINAVGDE